MSLFTRARWRGGELNLAAPRAHPHKGGHDHHVVKRCLDEQLFERPVLCAGVYAPGGRASSGRQQLLDRFAEGLACLGVAAIVEDDRQDTPRRFGANERNGPI